MTTQASSHDARIDNLVGQIGDAVKLRGITADEAADRLAQIGVPEELVREGLRRFKELTGRIKTLREPGGIIAQGLEDWYPGPGPGDRFWPAYRDFLVRKHWESDGQPLRDLDVSSTRVVSLLSPPGAGTIRTKGLVLGYVQSGKTANYTAVIAKAADAGYRFFIVLSGLNNALRNQTQKRLNRDLIAQNPEQWITLTEAARDFRENTNVNSFLSDHQTMKVLGVVKKHKGRLERLLHWLRGARENVLRECPILVIDDEADQASPNAHPNPADRTAINAVLIDLLRHLPKAAYVGYTATPFANLLIDPEPIEDLYPRDFIIDLPRGEGYFGPEQIFGRDPVEGEEGDAGSDGLDMIRVVPSDELPMLQPPTRDQRHGYTPAVVPSLETALLYFWMVTAARHVRGQHLEHSTMLVHTTQYTVVHNNFSPIVSRFRDHVAERAARGESELLGRLRQLWEDEAAAVPADTFGERSVSFDELLPRFCGVVEKTDVVVENSSSAIRLDYDVDEGEPGRIYIVIGGNVLSRGLTLEGLSVSYFVRSASAYDTLLQMGRWFGYRRGYEDLPRIWMTDELRDYFYDLATVEREIRIDVDRYKNGLITPLEFGVRIRTHPHLAITSRLKMQHATVAKMSFAGSAPQTLVFKHTDEAWLNRNLQAGRTLIARMLGSGKTPDTLQDRPHFIFRGVAVNHILDFLSEYQIHEHHVEMRADMMRGYIRAQNALGRIREWNVGIISKDGSDAGAIDLGLPQGNAPLVTRTRFLRGDLHYADIKALMSQMDVAADVDLAAEELRRMTSRAKLLQTRDISVPDRGLLLLYPIAKDSKYTGKDPYRRDLNAVQHMLGLAVVFPDVGDAATNGTPQTTYITVQLPDRPLEHVEEEDLQEEDE